MIRIISVDDEQGCLSAFRIICEEIPQVEYLGGFDNPEKALEFVKENQVDIAFLDIEMPVMNGLELAEKINRLNKGTSVVFVTAYENYAVQAFAVDACGYILKPYEKSEIVQKIWVLGNYSPQDNDKKVFARTFGQFEVAVDGELLHFTSGKSKELLALLLDRRGEVVTTQQAVKYLWPNRPCDQKTKALYRMAVAALKKTLVEAEAIDILLDQWGSKGVNVGRIQCDCWQEMADNAGEEEIYPEQYLPHYSWAEETRERLRMIQKVRNAEKENISEAVGAYW